MNRTPNFNLPYVEDDDFQSSYPAVSLDLATLLDQALTTKADGSGLGLRVDTTVGTRVLLDHPGGTLMLSGDTGWRDVTPPLPNAKMTSGQILIRRENSTLLVWLKDIMFDAMTNPTTLASFTTVTGMIPAPGIRTSFDIGDSDVLNMDEILVYGSTTVYVRWQSRTTPTGRAGTAPATTKPRSGIVRLALASETWPTTLPGLPA